MLHMQEPAEAQEIIKAERPDVNVRYLCLALCLNYKFSYTLFLRCHTCNEKYMNKRKWSRLNDNFAVRSVYYEHVGQTKCLMFNIRLQSDSRF